MLDGGGSNWGATQEDSGVRMKRYRRKPDQEGGKMHSRWKFQAGGLQGEFGNCLCLVWRSKCVGRCCFCFFSFLKENSLCINEHLSVL